MAPNINGIVLSSFQDKRETTKNGRMIPVTEAWRPYQMEVDVKQCCRRLVSRRRDEKHVVKYIFFLFANHHTVHAFSVRSGWHDTYVDMQSLANTCFLAILRINFNDPPCFCGS